MKLWDLNKVSFKKNKINKKSRILINPNRASLFAFANVVLIIRVFTTNNFKLYYRFIFEALASHQCGLGSIPSRGVLCGLSLLVLYSAPRSFSKGTPIIPFPKKPNNAKFEFDPECTDTC